MQLRDIDCLQQRPIKESRDMPYSTSNMKIKRRPMGLANPVNLITQNCEYSDDG